MARLGDALPWVVSIPTHEVGPAPYGDPNWRMALPETDRRVYAKSEDEAIAEGVRSAHRDLGVPALRSLIARSIAVANAERVPYYDPVLKDFR